LEIYLHIGLEKTGSTSIQHYLTKYRNKLLENNILYPNSLHTPNNEYIYLLFSDIEKTDDLKIKHRLISKEKYIEFIEKTKKAFIDEIYKTNPTKIIISNEHLSSRLSRQNIEDLNKFLKSITPNIKVIAYVRRQDKLIESLYSTVIKSGGVLSIDEFIEKIKFRKDLKFFSFFNMWADIFGKENLIIRIFDKEKLYKNDIVCDFKKALNLNWLPEEKILANKSLGIKKIELLRELNKRIPLIVKHSINPLRGNILDLLNKFKMEDYPLEITNQQRTDLLNFFKEENEKFFKSYFNTDNLFIIKEDTKNKHENIQLTKKEILDFFAYVWNFKQQQVND